MTPIESTHLFFFFLLLVFDKCASGLPGSSPKRPGSHPFLHNCIINHRVFEPLLASLRQLACLRHTGKVWRRTVDDTYSYIRDVSCHVCASSHPSPRSVDARKFQYTGEPGKEPFRQENGKLVPFFTLY